jgi:hypothetical protein
MPPSTINDAVLLLPCEIAVLYVSDWALAEANSNRKATMQIVSFMNDPFTIRFVQHLR